MTEGLQDEVGGPFGAIDSKLNVFALANGMDLSKGDGYRRLEWFTEGLERGILVEASALEMFRVTVLSWRTGVAESRKETVQRDAVPIGEISGVLTEAIDAANGL